ncbi:metal-dependent hydrolase, partial [Arthrospira platensis SPKY2]
DFDFLARKYEGSRFLKVHHGMTHSVAGIVIQTLAVSLPAWFVFNRIPLFNAGSPPFHVLAIISLFAVSSHIFLDWIMHNNGLPLLWPFQQKRSCLPLILGVNPRTVSHDCGENII